MTSFIPNALTLARLVLAPVVAWCMWKGFSIPYAAEYGPDAASLTAEAARAAQAAGDSYKLWAAGLFVFAALTDLFDGMAARMLNADSKLGRIIDPIADKALVGLPLLAFLFITSRTQAGINIWVAIPVLAIIGRDIFITIMRMLAPDGEGARVSTLAKFKTALELIAVAMPIFMALPQISFSPILNMVWMVALWTAAALSLFTAFGYLLTPAATTDDA